MSAASKNIRVVVRVRPPNTRELEQNQRTIIKCDTQRTLIFDPDEDEDEFFYHGAKQFHRDITRKQNKKLPMEFDEIFDDTAANADVFEASMKPLVRSVMDGFNCSAFVYGATGAGKTFTMLGSEMQPGITYLTMAYLFECIEALSNERKFDIGISYLEVYNEQVMNLLAKSEPLKLREDAGGVVVGGLRLRFIHSAEELLALLALGNRNRTQHPTDANAESSRSHAIFQVHIRMVNKSSGQKNTVKLSMIDLAGSERAASTKGIGQRFKEGASINKSLLALGNCINKLADGAKHIPYRDSNLTRIIKDSLGGNCQTVMIANVSPSSLTYEDTYNTLKYASRAKKIRSSAKLNICKNNTPKEVLVKQLTDQHDELLRLRERVAQLETALAQSAAAAGTAGNRLAAGLDVDAELRPWYERIDAVYRAMGHLMEGTLRIDSDDKVAKFRSEIKQHADQAMLSLVLDGNSVKADLAYITASAVKSEPHHEIMQQNRARLTEKKLELKKLKRDIAECNYADILKRYLIGKENEFESVKKDCKNFHVLKINQIYNGEVQHLLSMLKLSNQVIQDDYYLLRSNNMLDINMRENLEQLKRLGRGRREIRFPEAQTQSNGATAGAATQAAGASSAGGSHNQLAVLSVAGSCADSTDVMDRFNITMADGAADEDDDDGPSNETAHAAELNTTVSLAPAPKRRNRSSTSTSLSDARKPVKKLFKADSSSVRSAMLGKTVSQALASTSRSNSASRLANVTVDAAAGGDFNSTQILSASGNGDADPSAPNARDSMDIEELFSVPNGLAAKSQQFKKANNLLRNILKENASSTLYQKVTKINPKAVPSKIIAALNKENKRCSPVRVSPRSKMLPRQNNASRARQRMLTAAAASTASTDASTAANLKNKFKLIPAK